MSSAPSVTVESTVFPPAVKPPGSDKTLFLAGAGVRGMEIEGKFIKFTAIGVYLEDNAVPSLAGKWKGKTAEDLTDSVDFFGEIVTGPFEKFTKVTMILPLTGKQYSEKVAENCVAYWKSIGKYTDAESEAIQKIVEVFKDETFPPGASILFTQSPSGSLTISFLKNGSIPEQGTAVIENKQMSEAVLESIIGKHGVSPAAKQSLVSLAVVTLGDKQMAQRLDNLVDEDEFKRFYLQERIRSHGRVVCSSSKDGGSRLCSDLCRPRNPLPFHLQNLVGSLSLWKWLSFPQIHLSSSHYHPGCWKPYTRLCNN